MPFLRVLEIGIGSEARVATRGLYGGALHELLLLSSGGGTDKLPSSMFMLAGDVFGVNDDGRSTVLWKERFLVDEMWPVSCQCSGVVQRVREK